MDAKQVRLELVPTGDADRPVSVNCSLINIAQGTVYLDFGFLDPGLIVAISGKIEANEPLPNILEGKLIVRVALSPQALLTLKGQIEEVLTKVGMLRKD